MHRLRLRRFHDDRQIPGEPRVREQGGEAGVADAALSDVRVAVDVQPKPFRASLA